MSYKILANGTIQRIEDTAFIPKDAGNRDYRDYLDWLAAGNTPPQDVAAANPQQQLQATNDSFFQIATQALGALVKKGILTTADVPASAQTLLAQRQTLIGQLSTAGVSLQ